MNYRTISASCRTVMACCLAVFLAISFASVANAKEPGRGRTGPFETAYLKFIIDHHYSALRMTELAAGTDATRDASISPAEGTSPTPQSQPTLAKAQLDPIKSMARRNNRMQREEILTAQRFLRDWYGIDYQPRLRPDGRQMIATLERTASGAEFDKAFLQLLSRHHFEALGPTVQCLTGADVMHDDLERYCRGIEEAQTMDIDDMRHTLCERFANCDYQPFNANELTWEQE